MNIIQVGKIIETHKDHQRLPHAEVYEGGAGFCRGAFCPLSEATVPITDLGFTRADAVYDVVTVSRGRLFWLDAHQKRFRESCDRVRLKSPYSMEEEAGILQELVALTGLKDAYVWWGVTRGETPSDSAKRLNPENFKNRFYAYAIPYIFINNDEQRMRGIRAWVSQDYIRIPPKSVDPRAKNLCALDLAMSLYEAGDNKAEWSVLTDGRGNLCEAPGSNVFVVKDGVVATPDEGCLEGITRQSVLELCREINIPCEVRAVKTEELIGADEAFLTSSAGGVLPVSFVNNQPLASCGEPGELTVKLHNAYWEKRWAGWHGEAVRYEAVAVGVSD